MKSRGKINIVHVGLPGIPFDKTAAVNRCLSVYSLLDENLFAIFAINNRSLSSKEISDKVVRKGKFSNITFQYTPPFLFKPKGFLTRRFNNFMGRFLEIYLIIKLIEKKKIDLMFFYPTGSFVEIVLYSMLSKIFGFTLISHYVEYRSAFDSRKNIRFWLNDILFDKYFVYLVDGVLPISNFLKNKIIEKDKKIPIFKIPPIVDFDLFADEDEIEKGSIPYFLYVGNAGYFEVIELILNSFELVNNDKYFLYLVLSGKKNRIIQKINHHPKSKRIKIFTNLEYKKLININKNAKALLVPLRDNIQDKARFPQKICEYAASANPIITSNYGEIKYYFKDKYNALVVERNDSISFAKKMKFVINNEESAKEIGVKGYETGFKFFNGNFYKDEFEKFIQKFIQSKRKSINSL